MFRITITEEKQVEKTTPQGEWVVLETTKAPDGKEEHRRGYAPPKITVEKETRVVLNHEMDALDLQGIFNVLYGKKGAQA